MLRPLFQEVKSQRVKRRAWERDWCCFALHLVVCPIILSILLRSWQLGTDDTCITTISTLLSDRVDPVQRGQQGDRLRSGTWNVWSWMRRIVCWIWALSPKSDPFIRSSWKHPRPGDVSWLFIAIKFHFNSKQLQEGENGEGSVQTLLVSATLVPAVQQQPAWIKLIAYHPWYVHALWCGIFRMLIPWCFKELFPKNIWRPSLPSPSGWLNSACARRLSGPMLTELCLIRAVRTRAPCHWEMSSILRRLQHWRNGHRSNFII